MKMHGPIFILWGGRLDEVTAAVFVTELRRVGLPVQVVGLHRQPVPGAFGLALAPDISLEDALPLAYQVRCLVVPGPWPHLEAFRHEPRLWTLLEGIDGGGGQIVAGAPGSSSTTGNRDLPTPVTPTFYTGDAYLLSFARSLAQHLLVGLTHPFVPFDFKPTPDASTSHSTSHPGGFPMLDVTVTDITVTGVAHEDLIRVAADSPPGAVAGAIAKQIRRKGRSEVQAIGAGAVNQMMKAAIVAQQYLADEGVRIVFFPEFVEVVIEGVERTAVRLSCRSSGYF